MSRAIPPPHRAIRLLSLASPFGVARRRRKTTALAVHCPGLRMPPHRAAMRSEYACRQSAHPTTRASHAHCAMRDSSSGTCQECGVLSVRAFLLVIIMCLIGSAYIVYKYFGLPVPKAYAGKMLLPSTIGLALTFCQFLTVLMSFDLKLPGGVSATSSVSKIALLDIPVMKVDCMTSSVNFLQQYTFRLIAPLIILIVFFGNWLASDILSRITRGYVAQMSLDQTCNVCGLILQAFYIPLCKVALNYYECRSHTDAPDTLVAYPAVICGSDEHHAAMPLAIIGIAVYVFGIYALFLWAIIVAPRRYGVSISFRNRFRFLVVRWRPDKWYWGMVYLTRNMLITLVRVVVPNDAVLQCAMMLFVLMITMLMQAGHRPWRDNRNNHTDLLLTISLCFMIVLCFSFVPDKHWRTSDSGDTSTDFLEAIIVGLLVIVSFAFAACLSAAAWMWRQREFNMIMHKLAITELAVHFKDLGDKLVATDIERLTCFFGNFAEVEIFDLQSALALFTSPTRRRSSVDGAVFGRISALRQSGRRSVARSIVSDGFAQDGDEETQAQMTKMPSLLRLQSGESLGTIAAKTTTRTNSSTSLDNTFANSTTEGEGQELTCAGRPHIGVKPLRKDTFDLREDVRKERDHPPSASRVRFPDPPAAAPEGLMLWSDVDGQVELSPCAAHYAKV